MRITRSALEQIKYTIGCLPPETGGMLGGRNGTVTHFYFDGTASRSQTTYSPDVESINRVLSRDWHPAGIRLLGFVHSHPHPLLQPSAGDLEYSRRIISANPLIKSLLLPIVQSVPDTGDFELKPFAVSLIADRIHVRSTSLATVDEEEQAPSPDRLDFRSLPAFSRVVDAYDLPRLQRSRVVAIGCGGAAAFIEDLARAGVGEFVLVDPDVVSVTNLATQHYYAKDIGGYKVDCLADRIREVNSLAFVVPCRMRLDELDDTQLCFLMRSPFVSTAPLPLLCGMTDDFYAQARVNRLGLLFTVPSLCAQVYAEGRGAELTFAHPDLTAACHRCVLHSRYKAFLEDNYVNDVSSNGAPLYSTSRLNALKSFVALALLHHGTSHQRWGGVAVQMGDRTLVQLRLTPNCELPAIQAAYAIENSNFFCDDLVWIKTAQRTGCQDCKGLKPLKRLAGLDSETRLSDGHNPANSGV